MRRTLLLLCAVAAVAMIAGCGSSSSGSSSEASTQSTSESEGGSTGEASGGADQAQAEATKALQPYLQIPSKIWISTPLPKAPEEGKQIAVMDCGAPSCTAWAEWVEKGAEALGWEAKRIAQGTTPQEITAAWNQVVRSLPDAVATIGIPKTLFSQQLATLKSKGIPVLNSEVAEGPGEGQELVLGGPEGSGEEVGHAWANWVVSQVGTEANVLMVSSPEFPITASYQENFLKDFAKYCSECETSELQVSAAQIGSGQNTEKIVAALRSNPDVNYIVSNDDISLGLPAALKTAGLEVPIIGEAPGPTQFGYLAEEGPYQASVAFTPVETGLAMVDWMARNFEGVSTEPAEEEEPAFIVTNENLKPGATEYYAYIPNILKEFEELWGVG